jgi:hypothetical protein
LLHASFRPHLAVTPLRFAITSPHLDVKRTSTSKLSIMHGVQRTPFPGKRKGEGDHMSEFSTCSCGRGRAANLRVHTNSGRLPVQETEKNKSAEMQKALAVPIGTRCDRTAVIWIDSPGSSFTKTCKGTGARFYRDSVTRSRRPQRTSVRNRPSLFTSGQGRLRTRETSRKCDEICWKSKPKSGYSLKTRRTRHGRKTMFQPVAVRIRPIR